LIVAAGLAISIIAICVAITAIVHAITASTAKIASVAIAIVAIAIAISILAVAIAAIFPGWCHAKDTNTTIVIVAAFFIPNSAIVAAHAAIVAISAGIIVVAEVAIISYSIPIGIAIVRVGIVGRSLIWRRSINFCAIWVKIIAALLILWLFFVDF
jgi:hypothetical protein